MKRLTPIFFASLIAAKILLGAILIFWVELDPLTLKTEAKASDSHKDFIPSPPVSPEPKGQAGSEGSGYEDIDLDKEEKIDLNFILKKKAELKRKEEEIARKRAKLKALQEEINRKIALLSQLRNEIKAQMAKKKTMEEAKFKHVIKAYSAMKPQKAATLIEKLDINFAIKLLSRMKGDVVGNILSFVNPEKAAKISEGLVKQH